MNDYIIRMVQNATGLSATEQFWVMLFLFLVALVCIALEKANRK